MEISHSNEKEMDHGIINYDPEIEGPQNGPSDYLKDLFQNKKIKSSWSDKVGFAGGPSSKRKGRKLIAFSWAAAFIDGLVILAVSVLFISMLSLGLRQFDAELFEVIKKIPVQQFAGLVGLMTLWIYQVSLRTFMGSTLGEWTYDIRIGSPFDRLLLSYSFKIILRSTLMMATGIILFPLLSMLFGQDILGRLCGVKIFSIK